MMFIFSADNLSQMYRRLRYVREYADYQRMQGAQLQRKQEQVQRKKTSLQSSWKAKEELLKQGEVEKIKLQEQEKERKALLGSLQKNSRVSRKRLQRNAAQLIN